MRRRTFLSLGAASAAALGTFGGSAVLAATAVQPLVIVITDITPDTPADHLRAVIEVLADRVLPICCVVGTRGAGGTRLTPDSDLARLLGPHARAGAGLLEIVALAPDLARQSQYFQARSAFRAREDLLAALVPDRGATGGPDLLQTIACAPVEAPTDPGGVRSAGFRNVLVLPDHSGPTRSETWDSGVVRFFGGRRITLNDAPDAAPPGARPTDQISVLSARDFARVSPAQLRNQATAFADRLAALELNGARSVQLMTDIQIRDDYAFQRRIAIEILEAAGTPTEAAQALRAELTALGLPVQALARSAGPGAPLTPGYWVLTEPAAGADAAAPHALPDLAPARCMAGPDLTDRSAFGPPGPGIAVAHSPAPMGARGLDPCGRLIVPRVIISDPAQIRDGIGPLLGSKSDLILGLRPDALTLGPVRKRLIAELAALKSGGVTRFVSIDRFAAPLAPKSPQMSRHRLTQAALHRTAPQHPGLSDIDRASYLDDARAAWNYFASFTNRQTGLCPATVNFAEGGRQHQSVTMWDVGTQINALVAATELGLIDRKALDQGIARILVNIRGRRSQDRLLPQGWIRTDRIKWGNKNFDGCDGGRLLASLHNLRRFTGPNKAVEDLVASWDLDKVIVAGEIQSVIDGAFKTTYVSHCAHYSALAFRNWGLAVASPYEVASGRPAEDQRMAILEAASRIGPMGAEPLLLEAMELGMSPQSAYLAEVLFAAQLEEYGATGTLTAVSETPIDRAPWFTYQGLQLDAPGRKWTIDTVDGDPTFRTPSFVAENMAVSSKAAYLWAAYRPHAFSTRLVNHVRETAKSDRGFASCIYAATNRATSAYSDINTNGIILQAIAHIFRNNPQKT